MKIFEDAWKRVKEVDCKSAFEYIATVMEVLEKLKAPGAEKADLLLQFVEESLADSSSANASIKKELVNLKENDMIKPYVDTVCKVSKQLFKINKKKFFNGTWCDCVALK